MVNNRSYGFHIVFCMIFLIVMGSCKTMSLFRKTKENYINIEQIINVNRANEERVERVWIKKIKGVYSFENEEFNFNSNIRIINDSVIIISIATKFGVEAIRIYLEKDSLTVINRFHKTWYSGSISEYKQDIELIYDFEFLEKLLLMRIGDKLLFEMRDNFKKKLDNSSYCYVWDANEIARKEIICFDRNNGYINHRIIEAPGDSIELRINYSKYEEINNYVLPTEVNVKLGLKSGEHKLLLYYEKWIVNERFPAKLKISNYYRRVDRLLDL